MNIILKLLNILLAVIVIGLLLKITSMPLGRFFFSMGLILSSFLVIILMFTILFSKILFGQRKIIAFSICFTTFLCYVTLLFTYQFWHIMSLIPLTAYVLYFILILVVFLDKKKFFIDSLLKKIIINILPSWIFIFILGITQILLKPEIFFNIFHSH